MRTIYVIAFDPDPDLGAVGGVDWWYSDDDWRAAWLRMVDDPTYDHCELSMFTIEVEDDATHDEITDQADAEMWDKEYEPIARRAPRVTS